MVAKQQSKGGAKVVAKHQSKGGDKAAKVVAQHTKETKKHNHNWQATITATKIRQAKSGNVRTYVVGQTIASANQWILIAEISQTQSPDHHALMQQVMSHVFVL